MICKFGATCIASKVGHQIAQLALLHCVGLPYWHYQFSIELVSSSARVTSVKSQKGVGRSHWHPDPKIGPQVYLGPIKIMFLIFYCKIKFLLSWWTSYTSAKSDWISFGNIRMSRDLSTTLNIQRTFTDFARTGQTWPDPKLSVASQKSLLEQYLVIFLSSV